MYLKTICWFCSLLQLLAIVSGLEINDFIASNTLSDGEVETRIHYRGVSAKETTVAKGYRNGLKFRQLTDGRHFIQLIYDDRDAIRDCEYIRDKNQTLTFLTTFKQDLRDLIATSNLTVESLDDKFLPDYVATWLNYGQLRDMCRDRHRELKKAIWMEKESQNSTYIEKMRISERKKRGLFILPGTIWCGRSDAASTYTDLGNLGKTDRCCRKHDHCKSNIPPFSKKFNYYNNGPFTISHCFCDASFRTCLKMVDTGDSNLVGKIFFDIIQTKCFILKKKRVCSKYSWWGKCMKKKVVKQAVLRRNPLYK